MLAAGMLTWRIAGVNEPLDPPAVPSDSAWADEPWMVICPSAAPSGDRGPVGPGSRVMLPPVATQSATSLVPWVTTVEVVPPTVGVMTLLIPRAVDNWFSSPELGVRSGPVIGANGLLMVALMTSDKTPVLRPMPNSATSPEAKPRTSPLTMLDSLWAVPTMSRELTMGTGTASAPEAVFGPGSPG